MLFPTKSKDVCFPLELKHLEIDYAIQPYDLHVTQPHNSVGVRIIMSSSGKNFHNGGFVNVLKIELLEYIFGAC